MTTKPAARARSSTPPPVSNPRLRARRNLPLLLLQVRGSLIGRFRPVLKKTGLTEQQFRILRALDVNGTLEPRELCAICHISSPSLAGVLARMESIGLVTRERLKDDQRRQHVSLTPRAVRMFADVSDDLEAVYRQLETELGPDYLAEIYAMCDRVLEVLKDGGDIEPSDE